jgi:hypothetical protein
MSPFDTYKSYLAFKQHFTRKNYDYFQYAGKSRASLDSFYKRKDRYFFEKMSRNYSDDEIKEFFVANFIESDNPSGLWIGNIIRSGQTVYTNWKNRQQSLFYQFKQHTEELLSEHNLEELFDTSRQHPPILKMFLSGNISIETLTIYHKIFLFGNNLDKKLTDPIWETVSMKVNKYAPFLNIDIPKYKAYLRDRLSGEY